LFDAIITEVDSSRIGLFLSPHSPTPRHNYFIGALFLTTKEAKMLCEGFYFQQAHEELGELLKAEE
jgi:hypothetical protein